MSLITSFTIVGRSDDIHRDFRSISVAESRVSILKQLVQLPEVTTKKSLDAGIAENYHTKSELHYRPCANFIFRNSPESLVSSEVISGICPTSSLCKPTNALNASFISVEPFNHLPLPLSTDMDDFNNEGKKPVVVPVSNPSFGHHP